MAPVDHARDVAGAGGNVATVLSVFEVCLERAMPGFRTVPLGVTADSGADLTAQLRLPLGAWFRGSRAPSIIERRSLSDRV